MMLFFLGFPSRYLYHHMPPATPPHSRVSMVLEDCLSSGNDTKDSVYKGGFQGFQ